MAILSRAACASLSVSRDCKSSRRWRRAVIALAICTTSAREAAVSPSRSLIRPAFCCSSAWAANRAAKRASSSLRVVARSELVAACSAFSRAISELRSFSASSALARASSRCCRVAMTVTSCADRSSRLSSALSSWLVIRSSSADRSAFWFLSTLSISPRLAICSRMVFSVASCPETR